MFVYSTRVLHLSEHAAYGRIEAARAARKFPRILELLAEGALTLTAVTLLAPHLTPENAVQVLDAARFKTKREVEEMVAARRPQPDLVALVRKLPDPRPVMTPCQAFPAEPAKKDVGLAAPSQRAPTISAGPAPRQVIAPISPHRYKVQLTVGRETHDRLRRAQDLLRHSIPQRRSGGDLRPRAQAAGRASRKAEVCGDDEAPPGSALR